MVSERQRAERRYQDFLAFDAAHPEVYQLFDRFTRQLLRVSERRLGARVVWERIRWETYAMLARAKPKKGQKRGPRTLLNDHFLPYYIRRWRRANPDLAHLFEVRKSLADWSL